MREGLREKGREQGRERRREEQITKIYLDHMEQLNLA